MEENKLAKAFLRNVALSIMNWLDANTVEDKMCLSNMECEDIENAVCNADWMKIYRYMQKKLENFSDEYVIVEWPDSQYLMEQEGFNENCHSVNDESGAYFVNKQWLQNNTN